MTYQFLLYTKEEGIGTVTINRPKALNALNSGVYAELYELFRVSLSFGLDLEAQCFALCFATEDRKEGMSAFLEKRKPKFKAR